MGSGRGTRAHGVRHAELRERLRQAEETLRAIREGEVDGFVVAGRRGPRVVLLEAVHASQLAESPVAAPGVPLSRRELQVLILLAQGNSNRAVAERLELSVKTVETYRTRLSHKLGLQSRADLYRYSVTTGVIESGSAPPAGSGS